MLTLMDPWVRYAKDNLVRFSPRVIAGLDPAIQSDLTTELDYPDIPDNDRSGKPTPSS